MFATANQFYYFCACVSFGLIFGFFYNIYVFIRGKNGFYFFIISDIIIYLIFSIIFAYYAYLLDFPNFRIYMPIGVFFGKILYEITFKILLAKIVKKGYNIFKRKKGKINL